MNQLEEVKKMLRSVLVSSPVTATVSSVNRDYKDLVGSDIPFAEMGYNSIIHLFHSIPDVLRVNGTSYQSEVTLVVSAKTAHVNALVMKQRQPTKKNRRMGNRQSLYYNKTSSNRSMPQKRISLAASMMQKQAHSVPQSLSPFPKQMFTSTKKSPSPVKNVLNRPAISTCRDEKIIVEDTKINTCKIENSIEIMQKRFNRMKLLKSTEQHPIKDKGPENDNDFRVTFRNDRCEINKKEPGRSISMKKPNAEIPSGNLIVTFRNDRCQGLEAQPCVKEESDSKVPSYIKQNFKTLMRKNSAGLLCSELPSKYKEMFGEELSFQKYGFLNLITMCLSSDVFLCNKVSSYDYKLYIGNDQDREVCGSNKRIPLIERIVTSGIDIDPFTIHTISSSDWINYSDLIPKDVLKLGDKVENTLIESFSIGDTLPIVISEIYTPDRFWIYRDDEKLGELMNSLQTFYAENKKKYRIPEFLLENGLYCVVFLNEFYRGLIIDLLPNIGGHVRVYFIDYGTLVNLPRERVWFLTVELSKLPAQAVRAKLANIEAKTGMWSIESVQRYKDFISCKYVFAKILAIEDKSISIRIADRKKPLLFLNDVLVEEGFAQYINQEPVRDINSPVKLEGRLLLLHKIRMRRKQ